MSAESLLQKSHDGSLTSLTRHQHWMIINENFDHIRETTRWKIIHPGVMCRHVLDSMEDDDVYEWEHLTTRLDGIYARDKCAMEFQVDVVQMSPTSTCLVIVVTAWRDLGRCKSAFDPRWTSHFSEVDLLDNISGVEGVLRVEETDLYDEATRKILARYEAISSTESASCWRGDEESAVPTSPLGTIKDMFENTTTESYTPLSRLNEERLFTFIRKNAYHANRRILTQPPPRMSDRSGMRQRAQDQRLAEMGRLEQWGGPYEVDSEGAIAIRGCLNKKEREIRKAMGKLAKAKMAKIEGGGNRYGLVASRYRETFSMSS